MRSLNLKLIKFFVICLCFFSMHSANSWWDSSHMVVAQIAENQLTPRAKFHVDELISLFSDYYPSSADFITASCWADDNRNGFFDFSLWHKQLTPFDPDQILSDNQRVGIEEEVKKKGLSYGITRSVETLKNPQANYYDKGIALRVLIHLIADAHMPLHCAALYNEQFPKGDKGGVLFSLNQTLEGEADNLHGLWDSCILLDYYEFKRPLTNNGKSYLENFAIELSSNFRTSSWDKERNMDVNDWIKESYSIAVNVAYQGIEPSTSPSEEYLHKSRTVACQQLTLAGFRLGNILNEIFEDYK